MVRDLIGNEIEIGDTVINVNTKRMGNVVAIYRRLGKMTTVVVSNRYEVITHFHDDWSVSKASRKAWCMPHSLVVLPKTIKKNPMKAVV